MNNLPPISRDQRKIDAEHLKLLSIFHFVGAGLAFFVMLAIGAHFAVFHAFFSNPKMWQTPNQGPPPLEVFAIFRWFYAIFALWFLAALILNLISGLCLHARKHRSFSLLVAGVNCLHFPFGITLGVFTIVVLVRDSVRELYESLANSDPASTSSRP
jgi:hypothetical protein